MNNPGKNIAGSNMNKWLVTASIALAVAAGGAQAAGDAAAGQTKSATCAACHGPDGNSLNPQWPKLAGQHAKYIERQIADFKSGARKDPVMTAQAALIQEQDIPNLAAYFSSQKRNAGTAAADKVALGEKIYRAGNAATGVSACMACHGPSGSGNPQANFPSLAGQHAPYVEKALKDFRSGGRTNDTGKMMQGVANRMSDEEIAAVAQYVQGLSR
ncbi:cytochrome c4 [endosymbiont of Riftia pachyptila (vent Ph05)]|nr:cytochrome c4 [endosymbiont of Riftia pachyptila (vent Ph05)]